ncbi:transcription factor HBP-1b(c38)-like [Zingiber officinale]|uniref:transcription factor HBP-1b(c38)-like n=1 Tax=Zingiber officinale TaxID=94328 RepID=UPI001C4AFA05|nr:transcription factor HBP-1b(c38)-like [Zingiber officinale]
MYSSHLYRGENSPAGFSIGDAVLTPKSSSNLAAATSSALHLQFGALSHGSMATLEMVASAAPALDVAAAAAAAGRMAFSRGQVENWGDSTMVVSSTRTDTSTDVEIEDRNKTLGSGQQGATACADSSAVSKGKTGEQKSLRRLAQNREAAKKSRLRKKAYVQQLESSRLKLIQLEQVLQRARQQGILLANGFTSDHSYSIGGNAALVFDMEYARWLEDHQRQINELRSALNSQANNEDLRLLVESVMSHYNEVFRLKSIGTKSDVFHILSGMWTTPAERCFMWLGGFRSSELLKIVVTHLEPLTDQQLMGICNLQHSSQQAEDALSQGMEALQQSLTETLASASLVPADGPDNVSNYMGQMTMAMSKLSTLENFIRQADLLRQQTLQQMHRILTAPQAARALLTISDYFSRLRALSSLWLARPRD